ncbi:hypothetical protein SDC9_205783 [bioreactor metagenome]|uniref:Uncharacterized protein n=1 Tax=bioreactor metagenome TaxID=1076179 RepID=A0A645J4M4_9ZZZZ
MPQFQTNGKSKGHRRIDKAGCQFGLRHAFFHIGSHGLPGGHQIRTFFIQAEGPAFLFVFIQDRFQLPKSLPGKSIGE